MENLKNNDIEFDWSCLPDWANKYIAKDPNGAWLNYSDRPEVSVIGWISEDIYSLVPEKYCPKNFKGDWKDSLFKNPNL